MVLWTKLKDFVDRVAGGEQPVRNLRAEELRLAAAALLVRASVIDGKIDAAERHKLKNLLQARFDLDGEDLRTLLNEAVLREHESVDLYRFTSVLRDRLPMEEKHHIIAMMWRLVFADGKLEALEDNLIWRTAELLAVPARDRMQLKQMIRAEVGAK